jgi:hypothetical protein
MKVSMRLCPVLHVLLPLIFAEFVGQGSDELQSVVFRWWHTHCSAYGVITGKEVKIMKRITSCLSLVVLMGSLAGTAMAADDGVIMKQESVPGSYCHEKFAAVRPSTLDTDDPTAKSAATGDVIDFYGPCDESPTGADQVHEQKLDEQHRFEQDYED